MIFFVKKIIMNTDAFKIPFVEYIFKKVIFERRIISVRF